MFRDPASQVGEGQGTGNGAFAPVDFNFFGFETDPLLFLDAAADLVGQPEFLDLNLAAVLILAETCRNGPARKGEVT